MKEMHRCIICLGSNDGGKEKLATALATLCSRFEVVKQGLVIRTSAEEDASAGTYFNQALIIETGAKAEELREVFKQIERENGRTPASKQMGIVPLDIDLLTYDETVLRPNDLQKKYVMEAMKSL